MRNVSPVTREDDIENKGHTHPFGSITDIPSWLTDGGKAASGADSHTLDDSVDYPLIGFNLYGKSVQDGTPTPDAPVDIVSVGDNGFDIISKDDTHFNLLSVRDSGGDIITKQPVSAAAKVGGKAVFSVAATGEGLTYQWQYSTDAGKTWKNFSPVTASFAINNVQASYNGWMYRCVVTDSSGNSEISNESTLYVVSDDCKVKTASIATDALPWCGIPVESGGNYTDSTGQQWICDELIFNADGTGEIVKRTGKIIFDGSDDESWDTQITGTSDKYQFMTKLSNIYPITTGNAAPNMYCDRYAVLIPNDTWNLNRGITTAKLSTGGTVIYIYDSAANNDTATFKSMLAVNPVTVVYQLATPQEIELTASEVDALRTLQTFNGVTNISNSAGAEMSVKYCTSKALSEYVLPIMDSNLINSKAYTDTKIESLNSTISTKANESDLISHTGNTSNPHSVTKAQVGLSNVPNVTTNDQTPSYTEASSLTKLSSGEKLSVAFGKISKAITDLVSHIGDSVKHITLTERTNWNSAKTHADSAHAPSNAQANIIESIKVNGTALTPSSKAVNITVPSVGNGTITIKQAGTTKGTFTTNQSGNTTIELTDNNTTYGVATTSANGLMSASDKKALDILKNPSATCTTARSDLNKVIALDNFVLSTGTTIAIKFTDTGTSNPASGDITLNINNTGAKSIGYICNGVGVKITSDMGWMFCNGRVHSFRYNGTSWECLNYNRDTWRGIQNNLTSDSTTDSLSAAQGKALKALVDGKAASSQTHTKSQITDFPTSIKNPNALNINGVSYDGSAAKDIDLLPFIVGTQTAATGSWTGNASSISALFDGLTIRYWLPYAGSGNATLNLTLANGSTTGAVNCYYSGTARLTTHYAAGNIITLTYRSNVSIAGSSTKYTGWWADANYDSGNTKNTTGSTNTSSKIFLIGATSQADSPVTYSHDTAYVGTDGCLYSNSTKVIVEGHTHIAYVNQNAFSNIKVGNTTIAADTATDALTLEGKNITLTPDVTNDKVTIEIKKENVTSALGYTPPKENTTYSSKAAVSGGTDVSLVTTGEKYNWNAKASTAVFVKSGSGAKSGLVPAPPTTAGATKYLREDGAWVVPIDTWRGVVDNLTSTDATKSLSANQGKVLKGLVDGKASSSHTHNAMTGATSSAAGKSGFVPAPTAGDQDKFLKADGTWSVPSGGSSGSVTMTKFASFTADSTTINNVYIPDNTILRAYYSANNGSNSSVLEVCELFITDRRTPIINSVLLSTGSTCNFSVNYSNDIAIGKDIGKLTITANKSSSCKIDIFIVGVDISENNS